MFFHQTYLSTLYQLLLRSFFVYKGEFKDKIINGLIWSGITILVFAYIMPSVGLDNFGPFMLVTLPASLGFFLTIQNIVTLVADITNEGSRLQYELTLPIPQWLVFAKYGIENAYQAFLVSLPIYPFGKLLLWNMPQNTQINFVKFYFIQMVACFFFGAFSMLVASITKDIYSGIDNIWSRIIFPIWYLGCFQFSWKMLYKISPTFAYLNLLNPLTYILEGSRSAALDPALALPYWHCIVAILLATYICGYVGVQKLKKRLDCL